MKNINENIRARRSFIFAPALKPEMFTKALSSGADIVCLELEDGVAPKHKSTARTNAIDIVENEREITDKVERVIRINSIREEFGLHDLIGILNAKKSPQSLMIPKVKSASEIKIIDDLLSEKNLNTRLQIIIETNEGLESCFEIAQSSKRIDALLFGLVDMSADLRCPNNWDALYYARSKAVHAAASAGIDIIDGPHLDLNDEEGLIKNCKLAKNLGFSGKGSIHPKQIPVINKIFTPTASEIEKAQLIIEEFKKSDTGLVVIDGKLIEKPVIRNMYRILEIAKII